MGVIGIVGGGLIFNLGLLLSEPEVEVRYFHNGNGLRAAHLCLCFVFAFLALSCCFCLVDLGNVLETVHGANILSTKQHVVLCAVVLHILTFVCCHIKIHRTCDICLQLSKPLTTVMQCASQG